MLALLKNWRADLTGLEQGLLAVGFIGGAVEAALPVGSTASRWVGAGVSAASAAAVVVQKVIDKYVA